MKAIVADGFYLSGGYQKGGYLLLEEDRFGTWCPTLPKDVPMIDYCGYEIAPGLVDTHIHGYKGADVMDDSVQALETMSAYLPETGVTSFLATTLTDTNERYLSVCRTVREVKGRESGAKIAGIYLEGPYFSPDYKGAQNAVYMRDPSWQEFCDWQEASGGLIRKVALAPERAGCLDFIRQVSQSGVVVALGHSNATYDQASRAVEAGARVWVHAYNGMRPMSHRELGMVGAMYTIDGTTAELICDGYHVAPGACDVLLRQKGVTSLALITDCMRAGGLEDGCYRLGEFPVTVANGTARLSSGNLAGSVLRLIDGVRNMVDWGLATKEEAIAMATKQAAASSGLTDCGRIASGQPADFIVIDHAMVLKATYINATLAYEA